MEFGGWIMLGLMWGGVLALGVYCFGKILTAEEDSNML